MTQRKRAIVLGASIAGLCAARVLSDHFTEVVVLERDTLPSEPAIRKGTPQARHLHQLLASGQRVLEHYFPGLKDDLRAVGAPEVEWGVGNVMLTARGRAASMPTGIVSNTVSRNTLEFLIRQRLLERDNVQLLDQHRTVGLITTDDKSTVTGVTVEVKGAHDAHAFYADLVVDATGRASNTPQYLEALGYAVPEKTYINAHVGYSTAWFKKPADYPEKFTMLVSVNLGEQHPSGGYRGGMVSEIENDTWVAILSSNNKDYPPTDPAQFLEWSKTLNGTEIYEALSQAELTSPVYGSRTTHSVWQHYEKLDRRPENLIVTGDAACAFNPVYGQGMSVAALDAQLLDRELQAWQRADLTGFAAQFQQALAQSLQNPWSMATSIDKYQPTAEGDITPAGPLKVVADVYMGWVLQAMLSDPVVNRAFIHVVNMLAGPALLAKPSVVLRVLRHRIFGPRPQPTPPTPSVPATAAGD